jgi:uncharacterized coiled-coil DUF342 family protein
MGKRLVERRLRQINSRLRRLRDELTVIDEQLTHLSDEADDTRIRSLVSETPGAGQEFRQAQAHADAMAAHRQHVARSIEELEARQDELLDALTAR